MAVKRSWLNTKLEVHDSITHGKGIFASETIPQGERLAIFGGDILPIDAIKQLPPPLCEYPMQLEERFVLGCYDNEPEDTDFFNHSCAPNSGFKGQVFLVAMRDIAPGEEITFDYAMTISASVGSDVVFAMTCHCGAPNCRGSITEDDWRRPDLRQLYQGYFSQYIQDLIASGH